MPDDDVPFEREYFDDELAQNDELPLLLSEELNRDSWEIGPLLDPLPEDFPQDFPQEYADSGGFPDSDPYGGYRGDDGDDGTRYGDDGSGYGDDGSGYGDDGTGFGDGYGDDGSGGDDGG